MRQCPTKKILPGGLQEKPCSSKGAWYLVTEGIKKPNHLEINMPERYQASTFQSRSLTSVFIRQ